MNWKSKSIFHVLALCGDSVHKVQADINIIPVREDVKMKSVLCNAATGC